jgi:type VI secretion system protein ImpG
MNLEYFTAQMRALHESAQLFAEQYPEHAQMLNLKELRDKDPYVERLLEGVGYMTAQIHERLDADLPEISETFLQQLWPQMLRPIPAITIMQFQPNLAQLRETKTIMKGTEFRSAAIGNERTQCCFTSTEDIQVNPLQISNVQIEPTVYGNTKLSIQFQVEAGVELSKLNLTNLKLYLDADEFLTTQLVYALTEKLAKCSVSFTEGNNRRSHVIKHKPVFNLNGVQYDNLLLPDNKREFLGFHLLQEYFAFREKYNFISLSGLEEIHFPTHCQQFVLECELSVNLPKQHHLKKEHFRLNCVPAVNLSLQTVEPINLDHQRTEYTLSANNAAVDSMRIYSVNAVHSTTVTGNDTAELCSLHSFKHRVQKQAHYQVRRISNAKQQLDLSISFGGFDQFTPQRISCEAWIYNGDYPRQFLSSGDINTQLKTINYGVFKNITRPSRVLLPPATQDYAWHLIRYSSMNYQALSSAEQLRTLLQCFDWSARVENQKLIHGIKDLQLKSIDKIKGGALRTGTEYAVTLNEENYASMGEMYLFARLLHQFFVLYSPINTIAQTRICFAISHEQWLWGV